MGRALSQTRAGQVPRLNLPHTAYRVLRPAYRALRSIVSRRAAESMVWLAIALIVWRTWYLEGLPFGFYVGSGSMAETLLGPHYQVQCGDCQYHFCCASESEPAPRQAVCPNCGYPNPLDPKAAHVASGDRVLILRSALLRPPRRWEVVALRPPDRPRQVHVKRVVGLPGETIEIRDGDVYINGQIARKTLAQQRAMAILVHDARYVPHRSTHAPPRWQPESADSHWTHAAGCFLHRGCASSAAIDWLTYRHWRRVRTGATASGFEEGPVLSENHYSLGRLQRPEQLRPTADLLLTFRVTDVSGDGTFAVRASDGTEEFELRITPSSGHSVIHHNGVKLDGTSGGLRYPLVGGFRVEVSLIDQQFVAAVDGRCLAAVPFGSRAGRAQATSRPFALGAMGLSLQVQDLQVFRDVYYTVPARAGPRWGIGRQVTLGGDNYYLLGDNPLVSEDSRTWEYGPNLPGSLLFGKPLLVHLPGNRVRLGVRDFYVPDPRAIRYIR